MMYHAASRRGGDPRDVSKDGGSNGRVFLLGPEYRKPYWQSVDIFCDPSTSLKSNNVNVGPVDYFAEVNQSRGNASLEICPLLLKFPLMHQWNP